MDLEPFKRWMCLGCGFLYDEALGSPEHGLTAGTRWADVPEDWVCPDCGTPKRLFEWSRYRTQRVSPSCARQSEQSPGDKIMNTTFVLPSAERGYNKFLSTGESSSYIAGHPEATLTRHSSFNFGPFQSGRKGFGSCAYSEMSYSAVLDAATTFTGTIISSSVPLSSRGSSPTSTPSATSIS